MLTVKIDWEPQHGFPVLECSQPDLGTLYILHSNTEDPHYGAVIVVHGTPAELATIADFCAQITEQQINAGL